jgi:hypothetical protein
VAEEQYAEAVDKLEKAIAMGMQTDNIHEVARNSSSLAQAYMAPTRLQPGDPGTRYVYSSDFTA